MKHYWPNKRKFTIEFEANGCTGVPDVWSFGDIGPVGDWHDWMYFLGGNIWHKVKADFKFAWGILRTGTCGWNVYKHMIRLVVAVLYLLGVSLLGWTHFNFSNPIKGDPNEMCPF
jgi:hypothetical protein